MNISRSISLRYLSLLLVLISAAGSVAQSQTRAQSWRPTPIFPLAENPIAIHRHAELDKPFTVAGECGVFLGQQNGSFESWIFPVKLISHFSIRANVDGYDIPIDVNRLAAEVEVAPDHTTITYSHVAFTVKEILFATQCDRQDGTGIMALFQLSAVRPMTLTFSFTPEVKPMWPAAVSGDVDPDWVRLNGTGSIAQSPGGWYMLHTDIAGLAGAIALPGSEPGTLSPYQDEPHAYPVQLVLHFDPKKDAGRYYPLLMAVGTTEASSTEPALAAKLFQLNDQAAALYQRTADYYAHYFDTRLTVETPDAAFDRDLAWAEVSIDQVRVRHGGDLGMVAGFFASGVSTRPGFGWFFGRDTLFTAWGIDSYGDFNLTRQALSFLIKLQRADGKMAHEYSQTADQVDWPHLGYEYAAADATPLFIMAMEDYVKTSGDLDFLRANWAAVEKAWTFETTHDTDGDGIYDNSQGTGWVEGWPSAMPHQEIYLASLDQQASAAMALLSAETGHDDIAAKASARQDQIAQKIVAEYQQPDGMYAFSHNVNGTDKTATIYPAIAWWGDATGGTAGLPQPDAMFSRWASHDFSTDWGTRDLGEDEAFYDPISYHQGSVWPLFTGWAALAEYRTGRDLSGYAHLMQNANLTTAQDLGAVTELLSGAYFTPFGRSTSHQMWSSAMVITPAVRGLFGVTVDALHNTITVDPHLPMQWPSAFLHHLQVGTRSVDLSYQREDERERAELTIALEQNEGEPVKLMSHAVGARVSKEGKELRIPLPTVQVGLLYGADDALPLPGALTQGIKVLEEQQGQRSLTLALEAPGGSTQIMVLQANDPHLHLDVTGASLRLDATRLVVKFPTGEGYQKQTVVLRW